MHNIGQLIDKSTRYLRDRGIETARLDAELLLAHTLHCDRLQLYLNFEKPLTEAELNSYRELIRRRGKQEPVAYLCGRKEFMSLEFYVTPAVLIPRPETEHLVEQALRIIGEIPHTESLTLFEVGAGSGAISIALAVHAKRPLRILATDLSPAALDIAKQNACYHKVEDAIQWIEGDLFAGSTEPCELIVSNPPYIPTTDRKRLDPTVADFEPAEALFGGADGMEIIDRLLDESPAHLKPGGWLLIEIGHNQADLLHKKVELHPTWTLYPYVLDLQGIARVAPLKFENP